MDHKTLLAIIPLILSIGIVSALPFSNADYMDNIYREDDRTQCREGQVLVFHTITNSYICSDQGTALRWASLGIAEIVKQDEDTEIMDEPVIEEVLNDHVSIYFEKIRDNPGKLREFFLMMPKGADLHHHITGAAYAETLIDIGIKKGLCVNPSDANLKRKVMDKCSIKYVPIVNATANSTLYNKLVNSWSLRNFDPSQGSKHDHFFNIFPQISLVAETEEDIRLILEKLNERAKQENILYLETMIQVADVHTDLLKYVAGTINVSDGNYTGAYNDLIHNANFTLYFDNATKQLDGYLEGFPSNCENVSKQVCIKFQYYALRVLPDNYVFTEMAFAFNLARNNTNVVGINLVGPEDDYIARIDYRKHMKMLEFFHQEFQDVKIDLHAGELWVGQVPPEDLKFHIEDAVTTGNANRIGHGVDIVFETNSSQTLKNMSNIAIEILLTSNEELLGVKGPDHPILLYRENKVPMILSTDDPGIFRTTITEQYVIAAIRYPDLKYDDFVKFAYNSIEYSFLDDVEKQMLSDELRASLIFFESNFSFN